MNHATKDSTSQNNLCHGKKINLDELWNSIHDRAELVMQGEPSLEPLLREVILDSKSLGCALAARLSRKLAREDMTREELYPLLREIIEKDPELLQSVARDLIAIHDRDPACHSTLEPLMFFKGFLAISTYRISHYLWNANRKLLALYFQSIASEVFGVDIHPAAQIGCGILLDHATSFVVGETAIIEDNVSILHEVTLGGTGKDKGDRHPVVRSGVLIGAGAKILGRVEIGEGAKIGAGSVVLESVSPHTTVAGVPARAVGRAAESHPALDMDQHLCCEDQSRESANL